MKNKTTKQNRAFTFVKRGGAGIIAAGLGIIMVAAPLSGHSAEAEVIPLAKGERMNQKLMAAATENAEFKLQDIDVKAQPKPETPKTEAPKAAEVSKTAEATNKSGNSAESPKPAAPQAAAATPGSAQAIAAGYVGDGAEFNCLVALWNRESHWNVYAANPSSGAYGIPQALPGSKMASAGADWQTNADTQIRWGLGYIKGRYGSPCAAWGHSNAVGWY